jgi:hypothetical protein
MSGTEATVNIQVGKPFYFILSIQKFLLTIFTYFKHKQFKMTAILSSFTLWMIYFTASYSAVNPDIPLWENTKA